MYREIDADVRATSFAQFCVYNLRDVEVLVELDKKFKFIELVNQMAHDSTCLFPDIMGTVRYVETAITNRAHNVHNLIVADKKVMTDGEKVEGALVLSPTVGLHEWIGSVDISSLYPSVIRSLNISPEKFVGQFSNGEDDWRGVMAQDDEPHTLVVDGEVGESKETFVATGKEWFEAAQSNKWAITAYGTVFDQSAGLGIVPDALEYWYAERKRLQAEKKKYTKLAKEETDAQKKNEFKKLESQFDLLQLTKKIQLNSTYGALLSPYFRLGRKEMGASVTACGRQITSFMISQIGSLVDDKPCDLWKVEWRGETRYRAWKNGKPAGLDEMREALTSAGIPLAEHTGTDGTNAYTYQPTTTTILLSDTDSCYFKTNATNKEEAVEIADFIAEEVNSRFPAFMRSTFNCQPGHDTLIKAGREIVGSRGLFLNAKKKYTIKVVNEDGFDLTEPKLKTVGSEMKKADTPKVIQDFLKDLMNIILDGGEYAQVETFINQHRSKLIRAIENPIALGVAKQINKLDAFYAEWQRTEKQGKGKVKLPGHVRAAINYNELAQELDPGASKLLRSGDKGLIFYLEPNYRQLKSIAFPADLDFLPSWFFENFKINKTLTEEKMIDSKLERIFEALRWEIPTPQKSMVRKMLKF